ncbi:MAG: HAD family hydrolase [Bacteroidales bacterium]|nr:HAD family hydrolase [Bacteroidales bacterium]
MRTLFLDRDGVVNVQIVDGYVMQPQQFVFHKGAIEALHQLRAHFDRLILVTNQQCVGKGLCTMAEIDAVHNWMKQQLALENAYLDAIYCCPHLASDNCGCRKPKPGMALQALRDFPEIDLSQSVMVGDSLSDIQFAQNAGVKAVHVGAIRHPEFEEIQLLTPWHFDTLLDFSKELNSQSPILNS